MFGLGAGELFIILFFALIFIGPKKLPELARGLGKGIREFQKAKDQLMEEVRREDDDASAMDQKDFDAIDNASLKEDPHAPGPKPSDESIAHQVNEPLEKESVASPEQADPPPKEEGRDPRESS